MAWNTLLNVIGHGDNMWRKRQVNDEVLKYNQTKSDCDRMLMALLGSETFVERWWDSSNLAFDMKKPIEVFNTNGDGRQEVLDYLAKHCYGEYN